MTMASITDEVERMLEGIWDAEEGQASGGVNYVVTNEKKSTGNTGAYC
ncbi:hypothetical protein [Streptomyces sp. NPDC029554]